MDTFNKYGFATVLYLKTKKIQICMPKHEYKAHPGNFFLVISLVDVNLNGGLMSQIYVIIQGVFFNWTSPEFAKCLPVSN